MGKTIHIPKPLGDRQAFFQMNAQSLVYFPTVGQDISDSSHSNGT